LEGKVLEGWGASRAYNLKRFGYWCICCLLNDRARAQATFKASIRRANNWIGKDVEGS
jgi:hypothetical protein